MQLNFQISLANKVVIKLQLILVMNIHIYVRVRVCVCSELVHYIKNICSEYFSSY